MPEPAIFLDSNVFLYAAGREHSLRDACRKVLDRVAEGDLVAVTSSEVLQEILHVLTRRGLRREAIELTRSVLDLVAATADRHFDGIDGVLRPDPAALAETG